MDDFTPEPEPEGHAPPDSFASGVPDLGFLPEFSVEFSDEIIGRGSQGIVTAGKIYCSSCNG